MTGLSDQNRALIRRFDPKGIYVGGSRSMLNRLLDAAREQGRRVAGTSVADLDSVWQNLLDSDCSSPSLYPEMLLITREELAQAMGVALPPSPPPSEHLVAAGGCAPPVVVAGSCPTCGELAMGRMANGHAFGCPEAPP